MHKSAQLNGKHSKCPYCHGNAECGKCKVTKSLHDLQLRSDSSSTAYDGGRQIRALSASGRPTAVTNALIPGQSSEQNTM
ncbi:hypothetical protein RB195_021690 [Necator americanus]|uniref:Uncharacterized protein n=1 Tax=Necator americanus TaxID=51031 RepID=A0ABR1EC94_NECAM